MKSSAWRAGTDAERLDKRLVLNEWLFSQLGFSDSKVLFGKRIKKIEAKRLADRDVSLNAFILSPTSFSDIKHFDENFRDHRDPVRTKARFTDHHVFFMYDDAATYISDLFGRILSSDRVAMEARNADPMAP